MLEHLSIGQIVNVHGFKGDVKVYPLTDDISRFEGLREVYVAYPEGLKKHMVQQVKFLKNTVVLKLDGIDSEEAAQKLRNFYVKVERSKAVKLPQDSYFICDIIGLAVYDTEGKQLGQLEDVMQTGSNDVYIVRIGEQEVLIPALKEIVKEINIRDQKIIVQLPEGLI